MYTVEAKGLLCIKLMIILLTQGLNESGVYSDPDVYFQGGRSQTRMAGASISAYKFDSAATDHYIYRTVWAPSINKTLQVHDVGRYQ